ncbi:hypothetical protein OSB04_011189 [Centaurea solstitialis]|uniref:Uncharacterized protein n=1 Tax=Centaurea solstitialis TaxID=347529 RepID=A0AA38T8Y7_9ASTR|nr:hypothetical protein OSB04_011189 [Centaurea solstitialis]
MSDTLRRPAEKRQERLPPPSSRRRDGSSKNPKETKGSKRKSSRCINVYGSNDRRDRVNLWSKLNRLCEKEDVSWVFFGDFNEVRSSHERLNSVALKKGMEDFNDFIRRNNLEDIGLGGINAQEVLERKWSDHSPILLRDNLDDFGLTLFKFYDIWLKEESVHDLVKEAWQERPISTRPDCIFRDKLKRVKVALKEWQKSAWGDLDKKGGGSKARSEIVGG